MKTVSIFRVPENYLRTTLHGAENPSPPKKKPRQCGHTSRQIRTDTIHIKMDSQ
jgi:hypothetical protein